MAESLAESWGWIKRHPYATAGAVFVGGAILVYLYYGGSAAPAAAPQVDPTAAYLQSEATQAQYGAQVAGQQAALQASANQVNGQVQIANIAGGIQQQSIAVAGTVALAGIGAQRDVQLAGIAGQEDIAQINANAATAQTSALVGFLTNETNQQYGYLNNMLAVQAQSLLSNSQFAQLSTLIAANQTATGNINVAIANLDTQVGNAAQYILMQGGTHI